jgi:hypothetical protein
MLGDLESLDEVRLIVLDHLRKKVKRTYNIHIL